MKFADGMKEDGIISAKEKLDATEEVMDNVLNKVKMVKFLTTVWNTVWKLMS